MISARTKAALAAAKARGVALGNPRLAVDNAAADATADALRQILAELAGPSLRSVAAELNRRRIPAARGGKWSAMAVSRLMARLGEAA